MEKYKNIITNSDSLRNEIPVLSKPKEVNINPKEQLAKLCYKYLTTNDTKNSALELEAKYGTKGIKRISKQDLDNVIKKLTSLGFIAKTNKYSLKIQPEFIDAKTGRFKTTEIENFRVEIKGLNTIQEYCKNNILPEKAKIMRKTVVKISDNSDEIYEPANFNDFNFRVTLKNEEDIYKTSKLGMDLLDNWTKAKKIFRYINRTSFTHPDYSEFYIDISIVRSSSKNERGYMIPTYNMDESDVITNPESYEIEIELNGPETLRKYAFTDLDDAKQKAKELVTSILNINKTILSGLQRSNYPISYLEQKNVLHSYMKLLFEDEFKKRGEEYIPKNEIYPSDFIGPSSKALQIKNITPIIPDISVPNITAPNSFCVTDKADGERHLLFINNSGKIYLISSNMKVSFTGAITHKNELFNSIIDGELILHDKNGKFINTFAAFDIYYINKVDVRARPFIQILNSEEPMFKEGTRLKMLKELINKLEPENIMSINSSKKEETNVPKKTGMAALLATMSKKSTSPIKITCKKFYPHFENYIKGEPDAFGSYNIFEACNFILQRIQSNLYEYEIDGLIFTPTLFGVGSNKPLEAGPKRKITWNYSFKWKPTEATSTFQKSYLTIDFLVSTKKGPDGNDIITPVYESGVDSNLVAQYNQYKTLILSVGYDEKQHGFVNPCQDLLEDNYPEPTTQNYNQRKAKGVYKPKQFYPTEPFDPTAGLCNVMLQTNNGDNYRMLTEEGEAFDNQTIVEFRYDSSKQGLWKWVPMRVRHDKTAEFKAGLPNYGNDYKTANDNWYSIHNPVTERMIATGQTIPSLEVSDDVYYNSYQDDKLTKGMRDFHNLFVKKRLITAVSKKGDILIDFACGKAGDFPKWISAGLAFVFGIDISKDNIQNRLNGACARYLNFRRDFTSMPYALFVNGNSALNIRSGTNMFTDKDNEITKSIFGQGQADKGLGPAVKRQHSRGINGFDVSSCQFAMHYMFENKNTFYNFIRNVSECTKINGYFIATAYDGKTIFNMLRKYKEGESRDKYVNEQKIWSVTKEYDATTFPDDETSLGYKISVYQDSINQSIPEYLINFDFLTREMDKYGFTLLQRQEAKRLGLPEGSGMFSELYQQMVIEVDKDINIAKDYKDAIRMEEYEKDISFLNRYFIYKKTSSRNAEKLTKAILENLPDEGSYEQAGTMLAKEAVEKAEKEIKPKAKALKEKLKLQDATEALEEEQTKKKTTRKKKMVDFDIIED